MSHTYVCKEYLFSRLTVLYHSIFYPFCRYSIWRHIVRVQWIPEYYSFFNRRRRPEHRTVPFSAQWHFLESQSFLILNYILFVRKNLTNVYQDINTAFNSLQIPFFGYLISKCQVFLYRTMEFLISHCACKHLQNKITIKDFFCMYDNMTSQNRRIFWSGTWKLSRF